MGKRHRSKNTKHPQLPLEKRDKREYRRHGKRLARRRRLFLTDLAQSDLCEDVRAAGGDPGGGRGLKP